MATKKTKQSPMNQTAADTAHALWLAGLGAVSIAQKRGGDALSGLIAEGHDLQTRAQKLAQELTSGATEQVKDALAPFQAGFKRSIKKVGVVVQSAIAGTLARLGIPTKADIDELSQRVAALSKQLKTAKAK
jgi:poly(hydroxyalkanoate) granule-associated protein